MQGDDVAHTVRSAPDPCIMYGVWGPALAKYKLWDRQFSLHCGLVLSRFNQVSFHDSKGIFILFCPVHGTSPLCVPPVILCIMWCGVV